MIDLASQHDSVAWEGPVRQSSLRIFYRLSWRTLLVRGSHVLALLWIQLLVLSQAQYRGSDLDQWDEWSAWSSCSSTCGPGIATRTRECGPSNLSDRRSGLSQSRLRCKGSSTQKKACEITPCPDDEPTAHEVACSRYNSRIFSGRQYVWEPFTHPPSPCKLACRARGQHFYANLAGRVQDGTPCGKGAAEAICDGGSCRRIGCDGVIGSTVTRDNCGICQGDGSSCSTISGIFTSTTLRRGLNDVISIPSGSTNINITELEPSRNLLLLQTFEGRTILNGGTRSPVTGQVTEAGTVFTYSAKTRANGRGSIYAPGPTNVGIKLKLLLRGRNPGIMYKFNVPSDEGEASLQQINRASQRVQSRTNDDALRDRMGISSLEAGPGREVQRSAYSEFTKTRPGVRDDAQDETVDFSDKKDEYDVPATDDEEIDGLEESLQDGLDSDLDSDPENEDEGDNFGSEEEDGLGERGEEEDLLQERGEEEDLLQERGEEEDLLQERGEEEDLLQERGEEEDLLQERGEEEDLLQERGEEEDLLQERGEEEDLLQERGEEEDDEEDAESTEDEYSAETIYEEDDEEDEEGEEEDDDDDDDDDETDFEGKDEEDDEEEADGDYEDKESSNKAKNRRHLSNTLSDEQPSPDSSDDNYRLPKYSQSFTFGERYKNTGGDSSSRQARRRGSEPQTYGQTKRSGRVVSFGLQYVDDQNANKGNQGQVVTVGGSRHAPSTGKTRRTYTKAHVSPSRSGSSYPSRGSSRRYQTGTIYYPRPYTRTHRPYRGSQTNGNGRRDNSQREDLLRRQRMQEAANERRRQRAQQERERYNQRVKEYKERVRRRQEQIAERRRLQRERYEASQAQRRRNKGTSRNGWRRRNDTGGRGLGNQDRRTAIVTQQKLRKPTTRRPAIRHYGEDGLYASSQDSKSTASTPDSVEIFENSDGDSSQTESDAVVRTRPPEPVEGGSSTDYSSRQSSIIPRVDTSISQGKPDIIPRVTQTAQKPKPGVIPRVAQPAQQTNRDVIPRVAKPVEQARPKIIPRVRTTGPLENTGGRRPSIISALSGGDAPVQETRDFAGNVIPNGGPVRSPQAVDRTIEAGRDSGDTAYTWRISGFSECTKTCGGGVQQTVVMCVDTTTQAVVTDENCRLVQRPDLTAVKCNTRPCPAEWIAGPWTACSASCGGGQRTRSLTCQSRVSPTLNLTVANSSCEGKEHPPFREECGLDPCNSWRIGNWSQCSARCGEGVRTRPVECVSLSGDVLDDDACSNSVKPKFERSCDNGPCGKGWFYQEWPEECPVECGEGEITRKIFCSGESNEVLPNERCDPDQMPETRRKCRSSRPCGGQWFTGPWSKCGARCGSGNKTRDVLCIKSLAGGIFATVDKENCLASDKPSNTQPCEREPCSPEWYMTSWSQCSKSCGTGYRSRGVKCLNPEQVASDQCPLSGRPKTRDPCNTQSCNKITTNETNGSKPSSGCVDQFPGCPVVKKARLCRYLFYREKCCKSCSEE